jgi:CHAT domain-containing protein
MAQSYHLAQINIAKMQAPLEHPLMSDFIAQLDEINQLADESAGFVWRLQTDEGDATALRVFLDPQMLVNMSVWVSVEALKNYVYLSAHRNLLRDRQRWVERLSESRLAMWWIPAGRLPTIQDGKARLQLLDREGPGPQAFTFAKQFPFPCDDGSKD